MTGGSPDDLRPLGDAERLNDQGRRLGELGRPEEAVQAYRAAAEADPAWSVPWYNLGLLYKYLGAWELSADCNREALRREAGDGDAWWNLGIASTALGRWDEAREAWTRCGISLPEGEGPIEVGYGLTPIRLRPRDTGEVVWCHRIDPARAIVRNIPLPESGRRYGDLLLHDGAPNGTRSLRGRQVPVFDELDRLEASEYSTYLLDLPGSTPEQRALLVDTATELGAAAEDWSESIRLLCRSCSEGYPHDVHDRDLRVPSPALATAAAALGEEQLQRVIEVWRERSGYDGRVGWTLPGDSV